MGKDRSAARNVDLVVCQLAVPAPAVAEGFFLGVAAAVVDWVSDSARFNCCEALVGGADRKISTTAQAVVRRFTALSPHRHGKSSGTTLMAGGGTVRRGVATPLIEGINTT
jgi:hypothetical protein